VLILATSAQRLRSRPWAVHAVVFSILAIGAFAVLFGNEALAHAVGRQTNLTDRTEIWQLVISMAPNPILGAGFDSFWLGPRLQKIWDIYPVMHLNEAHNGYIETYLNLGWIGVALIALILLTGYRNAVKSLAQGEKFGPNSLLLAYIFTAAFYSITEAGFRELFVLWIFFLLAVVASAGTPQRSVRARRYLDQPVPRPDSVSPILS
jgi:exopolysaccharide production protein ExoQ